MFGARRRKRNGFGAKPKESIAQSLTTFSMQYGSGLRVLEKRPPGQSVRVGRERTAIPIGSGETAGHMRVSKKKWLPRNSRLCFRQSSHDPRSEFSSDTHAARNLLLQAALMQLLDRRHVAVVLCCLLDVFPSLLRMWAIVRNSVPRLLRRSCYFLYCVHDDCPFIFQLNCRYRMVPSKSASVR